jgi:type VI secretion system secreted protein Hcp
VAITKPVDASSTQLALAAASGQSLPGTVRVVSRRMMPPNPAVFRAVPLTGVRVASYQVAVGDSALPTEQVQLSFATIRWTYFEQRPDGTAAPSQGGWDVVQNRAL